MFYINITSNDNIYIFGYYNQKIEPGAKNKMLSYKHLKIVKIKQGSGIWHISGHDFHFKENDIIILSIIDRRLLKFVEPPTPVIIEVLEFLPIYTYPYLHINSMFFTKSKDFSNVLPYDNTLTKKINTAFSDIIAEISGNNPLKNEMIHSLIINIIVNITRIYEKNYMLGRQKKTEISLERYNMLYEILTFIDDRISEDLSENRLSKKFGISESTLCKLFSQYMNLSLPAYIRRCRVHNVLQILGNKNCTVLEAALESGFGSSSGFYKAFKEITGSAPTEILKHNAGKNNNG